MKAIFRTDASIQIGTGHVMRCLTLASALAQKGAQVSFICREHPGNLIARIEQAGFSVHRLTSHTNEESVVSESTKPAFQTGLFHAQWLGVTQQQDAEDCLPILKSAKPDWLIADHYALDEQWQVVLKPYVGQLMVMDDLGDRNHLCDLLLDQNYGATVEKYRHRVPKACRILAGVDYALLRPEFAQWRSFSLKRRAAKPFLQHLLITLGGVDANNDTDRILRKLAEIPLPNIQAITVIMGATAPYLQSVVQQAETMPVKTTVKTDVTNMAEWMANADLAIGAAGATTWERCCLGLPTIQVVIAENQRQSTNALARDGVVLLMEQVGQLPKLIVAASEKLRVLSEKSSSLSDGLGCVRVVQNLLELSP